MLLETLGIGLIIPVVSLLTQSDLTNSIPAAQPLLEYLGYPSRETLVIGAMIILVCIYAIKNVFLAFLAWRQAKFTFDVSIRLSQFLFELYLRQPYSFHLQRNSAQLIRNVTNEVSLFTDCSIAPGMVLITESLVLLGVCVLLLGIEPLGTIVVMSVLGIAGSAFYFLTRKHITKWGQARQYHDGLRIQHLQQGLGGAKDVKLLGRESEFLEQYRIHNTQSALVGKHQKYLQHLPRLWLELLIVLGLSALVLIMLAQGRAFDVILPVLGLFGAAAFRLMPSINRIITSAQTMRFGLPVINVLHDEIKQLSPIDTTSTQNRYAFSKSLELSHVTYTYPGGAVPAIEDISLKIGRGESVGITGPSGAGKSTLVDILLGLLTPDSGQVQVNGQDILNHIRAWQNQIGYVPQSIYLTDDTLRRNVAFGLSNDQIDENSVWNAICAAQLESFVQSLSMGLDTLVGERGVRLSGGQRQRIGIARALYHDPAVLVLDEATSSLDTTTERSVMEAVRALHGSKTIIIVAHRLSTVEHCDRLYQLDHGRLIGEGTPAKIITNHAY